MPKEKKYTLQSHQNSLNTADNVMEHGGENPSKSVCNIKVTKCFFTLKEIKANNKGTQLYIVTGAS